MRPLFILLFVNAVVHFSAAHSLCAQTETGQVGDGSGGLEVIYFSDLPGETKSAVPTVIRSVEVTEVFFKDVSQSYVIAEDNKHNDFFAAFLAASKLNKRVIFRVDPVCRRILAVDGVRGATSKRNPASEETEDELTADEKGENEEAPKKKRRRRKAIKGPITTTVM